MSGRHGRTAIFAVRVGPGAALALATCWGVITAVALAQATEPNVSMRASMRPDRLGASTALTMAFEFSGGGGGGGGSGGDSGGGGGGSGEEVPPPLRREVLRLPAGLGIDLRGVTTCARTRLQRLGATGCPARSLVGRGHAVAEARTGSLTTPEDVVISVFRGPDQRGRPVLEILGQGETPLQEHSVSTALIEPDVRPYGMKLLVSVPPIPTLHYEPDASFASISLTLGRVGRGPRAHAASATITAPRSCPAGGWPFAARFTFADASTAGAFARVACP